ncbi:MAG TPA: DUF4157 domain-containing protein, partial [Kofleriaceae bacterium]|nr:DUF4157 domain-containing protein [Kofleriaceae bacterium]
MSHVRAHTGVATDQAAAQLGAKAYAHGSNVAFAGGQPDLHTAAHEAAHVVQQGAGVQLKGGIDGGSSDPHERQAAAAGDAVVAGKSAAPILDQVTPSGGPPTASVQRKPEGEHFTASSSSETSIIGLTAQEYARYNSTKIALGILGDLAETAFSMPTPYALWKSGSSADFAAALWAPIQGKPGFLYANNHGDDRA